MNRKSKKSFDDDLDDDLDDLLRSDDEGTLKKPTATKISSNTSATTKKKDEKTDAYYGSLAAQAKAAGTSDNLSDVSDADPKDLLQNINVDALDASLFGASKSSGVASSGNSLDKSLPPRPSVQEISHYDDPLAGLLGGNERKVKSSAPVEEKEQRQSAEAGADSRRLQVERPPTRSGSQNTTNPGGGKSKNTSDDVNFDDDDDDDPLFGIDSPPNKRKPQSGKSSNLDDERPESGKSVLDELFGRKSEKPLLSSAEQKMTFDSFNYKKEPEAKDDGIAFGSYVPSASTSRPSSKRSVRFDNSADFGNRPSSDDKLRNTAPATFLESLVAKDDRDWLDIATGAPGAPSGKAKTDNRPSSEGQMRNKMTKNAPQQLTDPLEWLGVTRSDSPDLMAGHQDKASAGEQGSRGKGLGSTIAGLPQSQADVSSPSKTLSSTFGGRLDREHDDDDSDWLGIKKGGLPPANNRSKSSLDWLFDDEGKGESKTLPSSSSDVKSKEATDDYLGFGAEVKLGATSTPKEPAKLETGPNFMRSRDDSLKSALESDIFGTSPTKPSLNSVFSQEAGDRRKKDNENTSLFAESHKTSIDPYRENIESFKGHDPITAFTGGLDSQQLLTSAFPDVQLLRDQQMKFMQQQQQQQAELQRQLQVQQERFQKQREEQLKALQKQQQQLLMSQPAMTAFSFGSSSPEELETKVKQLEAEKQFLQNLMETLRHQHEEEKSLLEDSYRKRLELNEETYAKRLERLKQENELMSTEIVEKVKMLEKEKSELFSIQLKKQTTWEIEKQQEIDRMREANRAAVESLRSEHQMAIERLIKTKNFELDAVANSHDHARVLEHAVHKMEANAVGLQELQSKVEFQHSNSLSEREMAARSRDENLKVLQDRLERQQHENEVERSRLQGLITKLEMQLTNQSRELEEGKWKVQQEESRLQAARKGLEEERMRLLELIQKDRSEVEKAKAKFLEDQQTMLAELNKDRIRVAEEKATFNVVSKLKLDDDERISAKVARSEAEIASSLKALAEEKAKLSLRQHESEKLEERLRKERLELEEQRRLLVLEKEKLEQVALCVEAKSKEIEDFVAEAAKDKQESQRLYALARQAEQEQTQRISKLQNSLQTLHSKERQIADERLSVAKERASMDNAKEAGLCVSCRNPVSLPMLTNQPSFTADVYRNQRAVSEGHFPPGQGSQLYYEPFRNIYASIHLDRSIRMMRIAADKDKEFLEDERYFLEAIKYTPYQLEGEVTSALV